MKKTYVSPGLKRIGSVSSITAAVGGGSLDDVSDRPNEFPPGEGSLDVCFTDPDRPSVCDGT